MESVILLAMKIAHHRGRPLKDFVQETAGRIAARDAEIRQDAFEAGYAQGHNDTVEGCVRDMHDAANDYIAAIIGEEE